MANTLTNFLVGIGYDYDTKGQKQIESGIEGIKSKALQLGAVVAGAFGIKALTSDFAAVNDTLGKFSQVMGVSANDVTALGRSIEMEGGTLSSFMGQLAGLERMRAGLLIGDASFEAAAGAAGINTGPLKEATNAADAFIALADQFEGLSRQQRLNAASALGLDEASIRLLSKGTDEVQRLVQVQKDIRPTTEAMTRESAEFNDGMLLMTQHVGSFADSISNQLMPQINNVIKGMNDWLDANNNVINSGIDGVLDKVGDNAALIAPSAALFGGAVGAKLLASGASAVGAKGLSGVLSAGSGVLSRLGIQGAIVAGGIAAFNADHDDVQDFTGVDLPEWLFTPIADMLPSLSLSDIATGVNSGRGGQGSSPGAMAVNVNIKSDTPMFRAEVTKINETLNNEALENLTTSGGG